MLDAELCLWSHDDQDYPGTFDKAAIPEVYYDVGAADGRCGADELEILRIRADWTSDRKAVPLGVLDCLRGRVF